MAEPGPGPSRADMLVSEASGALAALAAAAAEMPERGDFHFFANFRAFARRTATLREGAAQALGQLGRADWLGDAADAHEGLVEALDGALEGVDAALDHARRAAAGHQHAPGGLLSSALVAENAPPLPLAGFGTSAGLGAQRRAQGGRPQDAFQPACDNSRAPFVAPWQDLLPQWLREAEAEAQAPTRSAAGTPPRTPGRLGPSTAGGGERGSSDRLAAHAAGLGGGKSPPKRNAEDLIDRTCAHPLKALILCQEARPWHVAVDDAQVAQAAAAIKSAALRVQKMRSTPFTFVDTLEALEQVGEKLWCCQEVAVDLENHSYRSFQGFVCLMQLSTRSEDFVIDALALRQHIPQHLGRVFAAPHILKVFHGANMDIVWLQRDFGIFVVNMFDTGQAARVLGLPSFGLAFLLKDICGVIANKSLQTADWRIRPLPADMLKYAREDTHYLLHIYDTLRLRLLAAADQPVSSAPLSPGTAPSEPKDAPEPSRGASPDSAADAAVHRDLRLIKEVLKRSAQVCLETYEKPQFKPTGYMHFVDQEGQNLTPSQISTLAALYEWRDSTARECDESCGFVMPNHLMLKLACTQPTTMGQLRGLVRGAAPLVLKHAPALLALVQASRTLHVDIPSTAASAGTLPRAETSLEEAVPPPNAEGAKPEAIAMRASASGACQPELPVPEAEGVRRDSPPGDQAPAIESGRGLSQSVTEPDSVVVERSAQEKHSFPDGSLASTSQPALRGAVAAVAVSRRKSSAGALGSLLGAKRKSSTEPRAPTAFHPSVVGTSGSAESASRPAHVLDLQVPGNVAAAVVGGAGLPAEAADEGHAESDGQRGTTSGQALRALGSRRAEAGTGSEAVDMESLLSRVRSGLTGQLPAHMLQKSTASTVEASSEPDRDAAPAVEPDEAAGEHKELEESGEVEGGHFIPVGSEDRAAPGGGAESTQTVQAHERHSLGLVEADKPDAASVPDVSGDPQALRKALPQQALGDGVPEPPTEFDFENARKDFNLWGSEREKAIPKAVSKRSKRTSQGLPKSSHAEAFDPLKALRSDANAGPKGGKRRQVFPRSGNRSATFVNE